MCRIRKADVGGTRISLRMNLQSPAKAAVSPARFAVIKPCAAVPGLTGLMPLGNVSMAYRRRGVNEKTCQDVLHARLGWRTTNKLRRTIDQQIVAWLARVRKTHVARLGTPEVLQTCDAQSLFRDLSCSTSVFPAPTSEHLSLYSGE